MSRLNKDLKRWREGGGGSWARRERERERDLATKVVWGRTIGVPWRTSSHKGSIQLHTSWWFSQWEFHVRPTKWGWVHLKGLLLHVVLTKNQLEGITIGMAFMTQRSMVDKGSIISSFNPTMVEPQIWNLIPKLVWGERIQIEGEGLSGEQSRSHFHLFTPTHELDFYLKDSLLYLKDTNWIASSNYTYCWI